MYRLRDTFPLYDARDDAADLQNVAGRPLLRVADRARQLMSNEYPRCNGRSRATGRRDAGLPRPAIRPGQAEQVTAGAHPTLRIRMTTEALSTNRIRWRTFTRWRGT